MGREEREGHTAELNVQTLSTFAHFSSLRKLWWPHNEAMIAFAMAFQQTRRVDYWTSFEKVASWAYSHLVDADGGEWWGYADRSGAVTNRAKGGAYKGCFHVPRCLFFVDKTLSRLIDDMQSV
jgi:N-acylglucosamine 2-epimerase